VRTAAKRDTNERAIIEALETAGYAVQRLSEPGVPDLLVYGWNGRHCGARCEYWLLEVKMPGEKLTQAQVKWHAAWPGNVSVVHTPEEALAAVR